MNDEKWIIDTDPGCDDMIAIFYLLTKLKGKVELISITQGNCNMKDASRNIKTILKIIDYYPLVMCGGGPVFQGSNHSYAFHKSDGLGNLKELQEINCDLVKVTAGSSALKIIELCIKYPKQISIFTIGPLSNLALAYMIYPDIINLVKDFYIMGGSSMARGNQRPLSEMNFGFDPIATKIVLDNYKNLVICGWECCEEVKILSSSLSEMKNDYIKNPSVKINTVVYDAIFRILEVFDIDEGGLDICDLYCLICYFNKNLVKEYSICDIDSVIDSSLPYGNGMMISRVKKRFKGEFEKIYCQLKEGNQENHKILVEKIDPQVARQELCSIFLTVI